MRIPNGLTEAETLAIINRVVNALAPNFVFGIHTLDDMKQFGRMKAVEALDADGYDPSRPLDKFLYRHLRNRYLNYKRDKLSRNDVPCIKCPFQDQSLPSGCTAFTHKSNCDLWIKWTRTNGAKRSLAQPGDLTTNSDGEVNVSCRSKSVADDVSERELLRLIDVKLPADMRSDWLKLKAGVKLSKERTSELHDVVKEIISG